MGNMLTAAGNCCDAHGGSDAPEKPLSAEEKLQIASIATIRLPAGELTVADIKATIAPLFELFLRCGMRSIIKSLEDGQARSLSAETVEVLAQLCNFDGDQTLLPE